MTIEIFEPVGRLRRWKRDRRLLAVLCPIVFGLMACSGDKLGDITAPDVRAQTLAKVSLTPRALIMAIGDTFQLSLTSYSFAGSPIPDGATVTYRSSDSGMVNVSASGLVRAIAVTAPVVTIDATVAYRGITKTDMIYVQVVPVATPVDAMQFDPVGPMEIGSQAQYTVRFSFRGMAVSGLYPRIELLDNNRIATFNVTAFTIVPQKAGTLKLLGRVNAFGVDLMDTLVVRVTDKSMHTLMFMDGYLDPTELNSGSDGETFILKEYGMLTIMNFSSKQFQITLTDPVGASRVLEMGINGFLMEMFTTPGLYTWQTDTRPVLAGKILIR